MKNVEIDGHKILDIALRGVRRAAVFMGLGINAARDSRFREYELAHITGLELVPTGVEDKVIDKFKDEFQLWIIESGFRELLERFALFLDSIHYHSLLLAVNHSKISQRDAEKLNKDFEFKGVAAKLIQLDETFGMKFKHAHHLETLAKARNCLTHRLGIVGDKDCNNDNHFELKWQSMDFSIEAPDRDEPIPLKFPIEEPIYLESGGALMLKFVDRKLRFAKGQKLAVSSKELAEICHFVIIASKDVLTAMRDYAKSIGAVKDAQPAGQPDRGNGGGANAES